MTKLEAKAITLEAWEHLAEHPEIEAKEDLPEHLYEKIRGLMCRCALCEVFSWCYEGCPLCVNGISCHCDEHPYNSWSHADAEQDRQAAANEIVRLVAEWEAVE